MALSFAQVLSSSVSLGPTEGPKLQVGSFAEKNSLTSSNTCCVDHCENRRVDGIEYCLDCDLRRNLKCSTCDHNRSPLRERNPFCDRCFEVKRFCANYGTCGNLRQILKNKQVSDLCTDCYKQTIEMEKRCPNFDKCKRYRSWNHDTDQRNDNCLDCTRILIRREKECPYFDECGGYRGWNKETDERFPLCYACSRM